MTFPIDRVCERELPPDFTGDVFTCDIDRTYLATRLSSLKGMARVPLEFAVDKVDIAGMAALLREIRRGPGERSRHTPLFFLSASPAQLRTVIERKMLLDGIEYDGTTFKDWVRVLASGRLKRFREQVGFKLTALLTARRDLPAGAREYLLGDDWESDATVFALYADIVAGRLAGDRLVATLRRAGVSRPDAEGVRQLAADVVKVDAVRRGLIRLDRTRDPDRFRAYAPGVVSCHGALQMALALLRDGTIAAAGVARVAAALAERGTDAAALRERLDDAVRRALVPADLAEAARDAIRDAGFPLGDGPLGPVDPAWAALARPHPGGLWTPVELLA